MTRKTSSFVHVALTLILLVLLGGTALARTTVAGRLFNKGKKYLENGDNQRAYMAFRELVRDHSESEYADDALFYVAKYCFETKNYFQAGKELTTLIETYPDSPHVEEAKVYFSRMRSRFLEDKVIDAMGRGDYRAAKVFVEEILVIDPENAKAKKKLDEVDKIIASMDYHRQQLEKEKKRLEEETAEIRKSREEIGKLREEAEKIMSRAKEMNTEIKKEYEALLAESKKREQELEARIAELESSLEDWRERARKHEAAALGDKESFTVSSSGDYPRVLFKGADEDPNPGRKERIARNLLSDKSPSIVLLSERTNELTQAMKVELVLSLDLVKQWPDDHYLKLRVAYSTLDEAAEKHPTVIYYTTADMDEIDSAAHSYRKKIIVAIDRNEVQDYSVSAFFVEKK